jgi:hypothetical protein
MNQRLLQQKQQIAQERLLLCLAIRPLLAAMPSRGSGALSVKLLLLSFLGNPADIHLKPATMRAFESMKRDAMVKKVRNYDGNFDCKYCKEVNTVIKRGTAVVRDCAVAGVPWTEEQKAAVRSVYGKLQALQLHLRARDHQSAFRKATRRSIRADTVLIHLDFTDYNLMRNVGDTSSGPKTVVDLVVVAEWNDGGDALIGRRNYDFICDNPGKQKNDVNYLVAAMRAAITRGFFDAFGQLHLFSDGGPKHFKNVYAMNAMSALIAEWPLLRAGRTAPTVTWNFLASYHGHSLADSHAGVAKAALRTAQREAQQRTDASAMADIPQSAAHLADLLDRLKSTTAIVLPSIDRPAQRQELRSLAKGIKRYHQFEFTGVVGEVKCRVLSEEGPWLLQTVRTKASAPRKARAAATDTDSKAQMESDHDGDSADSSSDSSGSSDSNSDDDSGDRAMRAVMAATTQRNTRSGRVTGRKSL